MSEQNLNQNNDQKLLSDAEVQKRRNVANNANNIRAAADIASKTNNPYAKAAGTAVKVADKISGGKASEKLGKTLNTAMKMQGLKGKAMQAAMNKMSESGTSNRIAAATNKKNNVPNTSLKKGTLTGSNVEDSTSKTKEIEDQASDGGSVGLKISSKVIKWGLIACAGVFPVVMFICLFMSASQIMIKSIGLGNADSLSDQNVQDKINKKEGSEELNEEATEKEVSFDFFIDDDEYSIRNVKLGESNYVEIASIKYYKRKYNEADLEQLEDFYPNVRNLSNKYDKNLVYDFFFKMYNLYNYYRDKYDGVTLDLPLLMSTLTIQSDDMSIVFASNLSEDERKKKYKEDYESTDYADFDYYKDWSSYELNPNNSFYDMELIAQHLVSKQVKESCIDSNGKEIKSNILKDNQIGTQSLFCEEGQTYKTSEEYFAKDEAKYEEFLKEFLEKKYFLKGGSISNVNANSNSTSASCNNPFEKYDLTEDQLNQIASLAYHEQGTAKGAAAEASLMANLFEIKGSKYGKGAQGLYNYIRTSGWFAHSVDYMDSKDASKEIVEAVKSVLVNGKRTLPGYIDEHDTITDIKWVKNDGKEISVSDKNSYKKNESKIMNVYGSKYTFYTFPDINSDPFGYTSEKIREEKGEIYYDFDTGEIQNCNYISSKSNGLSSAFVSLAVSQLNEPDRYTGDKYQEFGGIGTNTAWCAAFVSWNIYNTTYNGQKLSDIIKFKTNAVVNFMNYFYNSKESNIKFYYNDSCSKLKGKNNGISSYTPKEGDIIFFDNFRNWDGKMPATHVPGKRHVGIVQYFKDGKVVTIEGNSGNQVKERKYDLTDCHVVGFGSWY